MFELKEFNPERKFAELRTGIEADHEARGSNDTGNRKWRLEYSGFFSTT